MADAPTPKRADIRNCEYAFKCPLEWDLLSRTGNDTVRHCGECGCSVYYCETDAELIIRATNGQLVARKMPDNPYATPAVEDDTGPPIYGEYLTRRPLYDDSPEGRVIRQWAVECSKSETLKEAVITKRRCAKCGFPHSSYRKPCKVCHPQQDR